VRQRLAPEGFFREVAEDPGFSLSCGFLVQAKSANFVPKRIKISLKDHNLLLSNDYLTFFYGNRILRDGFEREGIRD